MFIINYLLGLKVMIGIIHQSSFGKIFNNFFTKKLFRKLEEPFIAKILYQEGVTLCTTQEFHKASIKFRQFSQYDTSLLIDHLRNLKDRIVSLDETHLSDLLLETRAIINSFWEINSVASMYVGEICLKICELLFDVVDPDDLHLQQKAKDLAIQQFLFVLQSDEGITRFQNTFKKILNTAIDGNQFGILLEISIYISLLKEMIEEGLESGSLMITHGRGLYPDRLKSYKSLFSPQAFEALRGFNTQ